MRTPSVFLLFAATLLAQSGPANLDFESGSPGQTPPGWSAWYSGAGALYAAVANQNCIQGRYCAVLTGMPGTGPFGGFSQFFSSAAYRGRSIRFRAALRLDGSPGARAVLWLRVDRANGTYLVNVNSRSVTSTDWSYVSADIPVAADSAYINIGILYFGAGQAWVDDASLAALAVPPPDPPRELSPAGLSNLTALARLLGAVRHFHPSDQAAATDWDDFAIRGAAAVEGAESPEDLAVRLQNLVEPVAPTVRVYAGAARPAMPAELEPPPPSAGLRAVRWNNFGVALASSNIYSSSREYYALSDGPLPESFGYPDRNVYEADLGSGVKAMVPLTLYADLAGTLPHRAAPSPSSTGWTSENRATRLGAVILAWSVVQNFYPYFDVVETDWPAALSAALTSAATDAGAAEFAKTLKRLVAAQKDGHGYVWGDSLLASVAPLVWDWVDGQLIVTSVASSGGGISPGDRILAIDGQPVDEVMAAQKELVSGATPQWVLWRTLNEMAKCAGNSMQVEVEPYAAQGSSRSIDLSCVASVDWQGGRGDIIHELEPGILYVDINRLTADLWGEWLSLLSSAKGIVFDLRGYPASGSFSVFSNLSPTPVSSAQWHVPTPSKPDRTGLTFRQSGWSLPVSEPYLTARRVFLTDGRAVSAAETFMGIVENYRLAEIVGSPTAGTNGNINNNMLPGGFTVSFTGMKVLKHDGSQHHGVGIHPTIPAGRTRRGIAEGKDEVLLRGIEVVKGSQAGPVPVIAAGGIVNAASFAGGAVAPGEIVTIFGTGLGPSSPSQTTYDSAGFLGTYADGTRVFFDDVQAPVVYASETQVNAIVPYTAADRASVRVEYQLRRSEPVAVPVTAAAPGVFVNGARAVAVNQNGALNSESAPAGRGEVVTIFATGEGAMRGGATTGRLPLVGQWPSPAGEVSVSFGGVGGELLFAGQIFPGVLQVNVRIPVTAPAGNAVPVLLKAAGSTSQAGAGIALR